MQDPLVVIEVTGEVLYRSLENAVSSYPKLEGRFAQVSGISFCFNPDRPPGQRIESRLVRIGDEWLSMTENYTLCIKAYMHGGCDGYAMFKNCKILMDEDSCPELGNKISFAIE